MSKLLVERPIKFKSAEGEGVLKGELDLLEGATIVSCFALVAKWAR